MRAPEEVAQDALGNISGPMRHIFGSSPAHHELLDSMDVLVAQEAEVLADLIRARDAEVAETARAEALEELPGMWRDAFEQIACDRNFRQDDEP